MQQKKGSLFHLMDHQVGQTTSLNSKQELAAATLNAVPTLAHEKVNSSTEIHQFNNFLKWRKVEDEVLNIEIGTKHLFVAFNTTPKTTTLLIAGILHCTSKPTIG